MRWRWISVNPLDQAEPPSGVEHDPNPPSAEQAAAILNRAFADLPWGVLLWLAMTTGARRGELCALRWDRLDLDGAVLTIRTSIAQDSSRTWEKDTKTHQQRRITIDPTTVTLLRAYRLRCEQDAAALSVTIAADGRLFSAAPDHSTWLRPSAVTLRFSRMREGLGWDMNLHQLRHYSATELIAAGVDVRTVAGRLGHGGGGATTLRVYSAWMAEADQKAAGAFTVRMPTLPLGLITPPPAPTVVTADDSASPYRKIAADLSGAIICGALRPGDHLPTAEQLKERYGVSAGTANRAIGELKKAGLVSASRGRRATVRDPEADADVVPLHATRHNA